MSVQHMIVATGSRIASSSLRPRACLRAAPRGGRTTGDVRREIATLLGVSTTCREAPRSFTATQSRHRHSRSGRTPPYSGLNTPVPDDVVQNAAPFYFAAGYAGWPKRPSRPFPPPFFSPPSGSFSDALSTTNRSLDKKAEVNGQMIRGITNGDDAMLASESFIATNDGVGQWATRERGHAPLWSRLIAHFQALAVEQDRLGAAQEGGDGKPHSPDPIAYLDKAYGQTKEALTSPTEWLGTTTASSALLHCARDDAGSAQPLLYVTQLGDCAVLVLRMPDPAAEGDAAESTKNEGILIQAPWSKKTDAKAASEPKILFATTEQWHYFDCPRQIGTNSIDTPSENAVIDQIPLRENDIVLTMSDGVTDNLWQHEISRYVAESLDYWQKEEEKTKTPKNQSQNQPDSKAIENADTSASNGTFSAEAMNFVAQEIVLAARRIAEDPFAASPYMEKAIEEGLAIEGGKLDDISCVAAAVRRRKKG